MLVHANVSPTFLRLRSLRAGHPNFPPPEFIVSIPSADDQKLDWSKQAHWLQAAVELELLDHEAASGFLEEADRFGKAPVSIVRERLSELPPSA